MKKLVALGVVVAVVLIVVFVIFGGGPARRGEETASSRVPEAASPQTVARWADEGRVQLAATGPGGVHLLPGAEAIARDLNAPGHEPGQDIEILEAVLAEYRRIFGSNPAGGLNAEITAALIGRNDRRLAVVTPDLAALNAAGEVVDRWGTPFYFHPVTAARMEILSAGPDRLLWTPDDVGQVQPAGQVAAETF
jgi:hypothetical protein